MAKRRTSVDITAEMEVTRAKVYELSEVDGTDEEIADAVSRSKELMEQLNALDKERTEALDYETKVEAVRSLSINTGTRESGDGARPPANRAPEVMVRTDPFADDPRTLSRSDVISRAATFIDDEKRVPITDASKEHLHHLIQRSVEDEEDSQFDGSYIARRILLTEHKAYRSAFKKYLRLGGLAQYNQDEQRAIAAFQDYELTRAASENTTTAGGFGVPVKLAA